MTRDRAVGACLGAAIGHAMGGSVECNHAARIRRLHGRVTGLLPYEGPLAVTSPVFADGRSDAIPTARMIGRDADSVATTVGSWVGALCGRSGLPSEVVEPSAKPTGRSWTCGRWLMTWQMPCTDA